ncbi:MAG: hypothetical protein KF752_16625 [Pirellulaceae bacterium]|nr:hypothetical protein [Pirellulaceae bacterium]
MHTTDSSPKLPNTLSAKQLTAGLILLTVVPFLFVVVLYFSLPVGLGPVLDARLEIGPRTWISNDGSQSRLLPSVILTNATEEPWENINLVINDQFHYYHGQTLRPSHEVVIPLKFFHTRGNQFYPPESQPLNKLTVYAQIPSGARAIKEFEGDQLQFPKVATAAP